MSHLGKLVQVEWEDAFGCASSWESIKETKADPMMAISVGWVMRESERGLLLVPHRAMLPEEEDGCGDMVIPRAAILHIRELRVVSESKDELIPPAQTYVAQYNPQTADNVGNQ
jgi:hypothetical protein